MARASSGGIIVKQCEGDKITGEKCGHLFDIGDLVEDLNSKSRFKQILAKARLKAFHWFHTISCRTCLCHTCRSLDSYDMEEYEV